MKYVALLRGINAGGNRRVPMAELRVLFEGMGFTNVITYINSGNVIFSSVSAPEAAAIQQTVEKHFGFDIDTLILSQVKLTSVINAIPGEWANDSEQKSDVLFLFPDVDSPDIMQHIGFRPEFETIQYIQGAVLSNVTRVNQPKSSLV